jgi:signal transduction histidine kinase
MNPSIENSATNRLSMTVSGTPSFQLPVGTSNRGVIVIDTDHRIAFADSNIFTLLSIPPDTLIGMDIDEAVQSILKHCFKDPDAYELGCKWLREHPDQVLDEALVLAGSEDRVLHRYSAPVFGGNKDQVGRVEIYSDITKRRELEAAVRRAYDELKTTRDQLVQSEKLRAIGEIASGVAHDFNNTLGIILGNIQLLLRTTEDENAKSRLESAQRAALDAVDTVRRIQEFTKIRSQEPHSVLDLSALASEVVEMMKPVWQDSANAQGRSIEVISDLSEGVFVLGNAPEIREVLINILLNAVQAMPEGGTINILTGRMKASGCVSIVDTGIGMTDDVRQRIFDPFFTTRGVQGTGLGMSVAYGIVRRHSGSISIESESGNGTKVTVYLPGACEIIKAEPVLPLEKAVSVSTAKILVVDDEEMFAEVLVEMLSEFGHAVCVARSGHDAVEQFKDGDFDLVLTDLGMPEMSGWQVAKRIKDIEPKTPVVLLTGWGTTLNESELEVSQVDMVLSKPVKIEDLSLVVAEALGKSR